MLDLGGVLDYDIEVMGDNRSRKQNRKNTVVREVLEWLEVLAVSAVIAFCINRFLIANSSVPTGSMETTIMSGDRVIGSRLRYTFGEPEKGDVAIFKFGWRCEHCRRATGENPAPDICPFCEKEISHPKTVYYVKRIIGMPGDTVEIRKDGSCSVSDIVSEARDSFASNETRDLVTAAVYVNGEKIEEDYLREPMLYTGDMTFTVPENCYFLMGDNRNGSLDARYWNNSYISRDKMIAKVLFRYWPGIKAIK